MTPETPAQLLPQPSPRNRFTLRLHSGGKVKDFRRPNAPTAVAYAGRVFEIATAQEMRLGSGIINYSEIHIEPLHDDDVIEQPTQPTSIPEDDNNTQEGETT